MAVNVVLTIKKRMAEIRFSWISAILIDRNNYINRLIFNRPHITPSVLLGGNNVYIIWQTGNSGQS